MLAAWKGHQAAVELLIARRADINHTSNNGEFALWYAAFNGFRDICEVLLKARADPSLQYDGKTAAQWAASKELTAFIESWTPTATADAKQSDLSVAQACAFCGVGNSDKITLKLCRGCWRVHYCCDDHQKQHWKTHRAACVSSAAASRLTPSLAHAPSSNTSAELD